MTLLVVYIVDLNLRKPLFGDVDQGASTREPLRLRDSRDSSVFTLSTSALVALKLEVYVGRKERFEAFELLQVFRALTNLVIFIECHK